MRNNAQREGIERQLTQQMVLGNIEDWRRSAPLRTGYVVTLHGGKDVPLTVSEANALLLGLASAHSAWTDRRDAEKAAKASYDAEQARLAAARQLAYAEAVASVECPFCGSEAGTRCVRQVEDPTPYADHPHRVRLEQAAILGRASQEAS